MDLEVGDAVFVVHQSRRGTSGGRSEHATIERVGRQYAYIKLYSRLSPFCRKTGESVHNVDSNARANGEGFDVYRSEADYCEARLAIERFNDLESRLITRLGRLKPLPAAVVQKFIDILDASETS